MVICLPGKAVDVLAQVVYKYLTIIVSILGMFNVLKERVERLEKTLDNWVTSMFRCTEKSEKLAKQLAELQCEVEQLKKLVDTKSKP